MPSSIIAFKQNLTFHLKNLNSNLLVNMREYRGYLILHIGARYRRATVNDYTSRKIYRCHTIL